MLLILGFMWKLNETDFSVPTLERIWLSQNYTNTNFNNIICPENSGICQIYGWVYILSKRSLHTELADNRTCFSLQNLVLIEHSQCNLYKTFNILIAFIGQSQYGAGICIFTVGIPEMMENLRIFFGNFWSFLKSQGVAVTIALLWVTVHIGGVYRRVE